MKKNYVTIKGAAEILGVSPMTLRRWDKNGKFKVSRNPFNNYRLYNKEEVKKLYKKIYGRSK